MECDGEEREGKKGNGEERQVPSVKVAMKGRKERKGTVKRGEGRVGM